MRSDPDVLIVGGGAVGLLCAYHLRCDGASVAVVERAEIGGPQSSSHGNTGFVGTHGAAPLAGPGLLSQGLRGLLNPRAAVVVRPRLSRDLLRWLCAFRRCSHDQQARTGLRLLADMKQRSLRMLRDVCAQPGLAGTLAEPGMVLAFRTPQAFEQACRAVPEAAARGVPLRVLSLEELRALEPDTEFDICGAVYNEEGAFLRVPEFVTGLARMLAARGVEIYPGTEVTGFEIVGSGTASSGTMRSGTAGGAVGRVLTTRGDFRPGDVVIAAGSWSPVCARMLGLRLTLQPVKGYSITVRAPDNGPRRPVMLAEAMAAVSPSADRLRFAGMLEMSGFSRTVSARRADGLRRIVRSYLPGLTPTETVQTWSGLRPCTPDSLPFLGRADSLSNVYVAAGHGQMGMGLAPAGGRLIAQAIAGQEPDLDLYPFRVNRFERSAQEVHRT